MQKLCKFLLFNGISRSQISGMLLLEATWKFWWETANWKKKNISFSWSLCNRSGLICVALAKNPLSDLRNSYCLHLFSKLRDRCCSRLVSFSVFWLPSIKYENGLLLRNPWFVNSETKHACLSFCNIQTVETLRSFWAFLNKNKSSEVWLTAAKTQEIPFKCKLHRSRNFENRCKDVKCLVILSRAS